MYNIYKINSGETLEDIAKKFNTSLSNLKRINGLKETTDKIDGKYIIVPVQKGNIFDIYIVKKGDTIYELSKKYNTNEDTLLKINGLLKTDYIYPGEELFVPNKGVNIYITKEGDSLQKVAESLKTNIAKIVLQNQEIYLTPEQLIVSKND